MRHDFKGHIIYSGGYMEPELDFFSVSNGESGPIPGYPGNLVSCSIPSGRTTHTVYHDPFIRSKLASRNRVM
jgi:hypothetical protein